MATQNDIRQAIERWQAHTQVIQQMTATTVLRQESAAQKDRRVTRLRSDYDAFCEYYFPHFLTLRDQATGQPLRMVHNAPFHRAAARLIRQTPNLKAVFKWPRGHAKSTHCDIFIPLWLMLQAQPLIHFMVVVGKSEDAATRLLGDIQAELQYNQRLIADFGEQMSLGDWTSGEFTTRQGIHFLACGRGQSPRGLRNRESRPDYVVIDDLDDDELCQNPDRVERLTNWVREALFGALDVGRGRFIMVGNLISKTSVLAHISAIKGVHVSEVRAVDKEGNPTWADKWTKDEADAYRQFVGYRAWEKEMMHNPIVEGAVFRREWIRWEKRPRWKEFDELVLYIDPSWKGTKKNDYKAAKLWGKTRDARLWHLRAFVRQASVAELVRWTYDLYEWAQKEGTAPKFYIEAGFMQDMLLDDFAAEGRNRGYQLPLLPDKRKKPDKFQRIEASAALWERGLVCYDLSQKDDPDMQAGLDQTLAFQRGMRGHDDAPDADEGALSILQQHSRIRAFEPSIGPSIGNSRTIW